MGRRAVLHSDLNNCYASIETVLHPELQGKYIAVCGSTEDRHGIVLAKNQLAKKYGVKTGDVIWEAKLKCPQLTVVPPHMDQYLKFSKLVRSIYLRYSPEVEAFGIDESWIELTGSPLLNHASPVEIANEIRETVKRETGLTVLFKELPYDRIGSSIRLLLATGLKPKELLALEPKHISEDGSMITIEQELQVDNTHVSIGPTKTPHGRRRIPVPSILHMQVRELRNTCTNYIWEDRIAKIPCHPSVFRFE